MVIIINISEFSKTLPKFNVDIEETSIVRPQLISYNFKHKKQIVFKFNKIFINKNRFKTNIQINKKRKNKSFGLKVSGLSSSRVESDAVSGGQTLSMVVNHSFKTLNNPLLS